MQHRPLPHQPQRPATAHDRDVPVAPASVVVRPVGSQRRGRRDRDRGFMATVPAALPPVVRLASIYRTLGLRNDPFPLVARAASGNADLLPALAIQAGTLAAWMASPGEDGRLAIVSGPARSGRTTLLDAACDEAARSTGTSVHRADLGTLDGPLTDSRFLRAIVMAFGAEPSSRNGLDLIRHIRDLVTAQVAAGEHPVLAIDGAELAGSRLDLLRALLTDATSTDGLHSGLRIVVTGTPECRDRILRRQALRDCLTLDLRIEPMTEAGLDAFIRERIAAVALDEPVHAGAGQLPAPHTAEAFSPEAVALIA
ncbi:MAG TPA: AAA family ATPase, partial [Thermomicrobiales bacterium]|nr:AAA family ATPase [Thermomicrobiales bacterium]